MNVGNTSEYRILGRVMAGIFLFFVYTTNNQAVNNQPVLESDFYNKILLELEYPTNLDGELSCKSKSSITGDLRNCKFTPVGYTQRIMLNELHISDVFLYEHLNHWIPNYYFEKKKTKVLYELNVSANLVLVSKDEYYLSGYQPTDLSRSTHEFIRLLNQNLKLDLPTTFSRYSEENFLEAEKENKKASVVRGREFAQILYLVVFCVIFPVFGYFQYCIDPREYNRDNENLDQNGDSEEKQTGWGR